MPQVSASLPVELTIYAMGALRDPLLELVADGSGPCTVDARPVAEVDAAGVQMLLSLSRSLAKAQRSLVLHNPSPVLVAACEGLGLAELLVPAAEASA